MQRVFQAPWCAAVVLACFASLLLTRETQSAQGKAEDEIKEAFGQLQGALKAKDAAKIWALLDSDTQTDAEKAAKKVKAAYQKANDKEKTEHEKNLGLAAEDFAKLDGPLLIKTKRFLGKYDEIPGSKITGVTVQGESATLNYLEADGDKEKLTYARQSGKWKVALPMPKFTK
jgi:hypothetical protein